MKEAAITPSLQTQRVSPPFMLACYPLSLSGVNGGYPKGSRFRVLFGRAMSSLHTHSRTALLSPGHLQQCNGVSPSYRQAVQVGLFPPGPAWVAPSDEAWEVWSPAQR